jgi:peptidoglycan/LPS O-acetylase OafA/YrhL
VVAYHVFELGWLTVAFPAMGVMFALGGYLTARSLSGGGARADRPPRSTPAVLASRFRRLLPSVWVFGIVGVIASFGQGYTLHSLAENPKLLLWIVPLSPPGDLPGHLAWAFTGGLWYLTAYLYFVLLTPMLLRLFQWWPTWTLLVTVALPVVLYLEILTVGGKLHPTVYDLTQYGACWLIGIAHHEGWLSRVRTPLFWSVVALPGLLVVWWYVTTGQTLDTVNLHALPVLNALWSAAFAAAVLRLGSHARTEALVARARSQPVLASVVRAVNARALTIYLWHLPCLLLARWLTGYDPVASVQLWPTGIVTATGTALAALAVGWVEDIAARRPLTAPWRIPGGSRAVQPATTSRNPDAT